MSVGSVMAGYAFVKITMDDAELKRGLDSAQKKFKAFAAGVNSWSSQMTTLAPLIATPMIMSLKTFSAFAYCGILHKFSYIFSLILSISRLLREFLKYFRSSFLFFVFIIGFKNFFVVVEKRLP